MKARAAGWLLALALLGLLGARSLALAACTPEPAAWRQIWREAPPPVLWSQWADVQGQPNLPVLRALQLALVHVGLDFEQLAVLGPALAALAAVLLLRLSRRTLPAGADGWLAAALAAVLLAPAFGADWLLAERARIVVPALAFLGGVLALSGEGAFRARLALAYLAAFAALAAHDSGILAWVALAPLVGLHAGRHGRRALPAVALWAVAMNVACLLCWDEVWAPAGGLGVHLREAPLAVGAFAVRAVALALPEPLPAARSTVAALVLAAFAAGVVGLWRRRADAALVRRALPWLAVALFGALALAALLHRHFPPALGEPFVREWLWPVLFLPIGTAGLCGALWPRRGGRAVVVALALALAAGPWVTGLGELEAKARFLRQSEAGLALAEVQGVAVPDLAVPRREDRDALRGLGLLRRAAPLTAGELLALPTAGAGREHGAWTRADRAGLAGLVLEREDFVADLVIVVRERDGQQQVLAIAAPQVEVPASTWQVGAAPLTGLAAGDVLCALAFDQRRRRLAVLDGTVRCGADGPTLGAELR